MARSRGANDQGWIVIAQRATKSCLCPIRLKNVAFRGRRQKQAKNQVNPNFLFPSRFGRSAPLAIQRLRGRGWRHLWGYPSSR